LVQQQLVADEIRVIGEQWVIIGVRECGGSGGQRLRRYSNLFENSVGNFETNIQIGICAYDFRSVRVLLRA
jgi:hypothetical protein